MSRGFPGLVIILMLCTLSLTTVITTGEKAIKEIDGRGTVDLPERDEAGSFIENIGQWDEELYFVGETPMVLRIPTMSFRSGSVRRERFPIISSEMTRKNG